MVITDTLRIFRILAELGIDAEAFPRQIHSGPGRLTFKGAAGDFLFWVSNDDYGLKPLFVVKIETATDKDEVFFFTGTICGSTQRVEGYFETATRTGVYRLP